MGYTGVDGTSIPPMTPLPRLLLTQIVFIQGYIRVYQGPFDDALAGQLSHRVPRH